MKKTFDEKEQEWNRNEKILNVLFVIAGILIISEACMIGSIILYAVIYAMQ